MKDTMERWERDDGIEFLRNIGIEPGHSVLDFGARVGHYSIPAALVAGDSGMVYALDKDPRELEDLRRKAKLLNLSNLEILHTGDTVRLDFRDNSMDVVLLYDVLHYLDKDHRDYLYSETHRVLKASGFLSVYPKHVIEDSPMDKFRDMNTEDVKAEIEDHDFRFQEKHCGSISHDDFLNQGCVFNFTRG